MELPGQRAVSSESIAEILGEAAVDIFGDYVVTINVHDSPVCFLIKNKESAESYKKYFEILWKQARK